MTDERRDESLRGLAHDYNEPPPTPSEAIWARIQARIGEPGGGEGPTATHGAPPSLDAGRARWRLRRRWVGLGAAAAAAFVVLGIGIGRVTAPGGSGVTADPVADAGENADGAVRVLALEHLGRVEPLLAAVRVDARQGHLDREVGGWGREMLTETRLLLDSPAALDPGLRALLEDLELILVQVAVASQGQETDGERAREELRLMADGLDEQDVVTRIQAVLPAGPVPTSM